MQYQNRLPQGPPGAALEPIPVAGGGNSLIDQIQSRAYPRKVQSYCAQGRYGGAGGMLHALEDGEKG